MTEVLYRSNTNTIELIGLQNRATAAYINSATVTVTIKDQQGNAIGGETWPLTLAYVAASNGNYRGSVSYGLEITPDGAYVAEITADGGTGLRGFWEVPLTAAKRTS